MTTPRGLRDRIRREHERGDAGRAEVTRLRSRAVADAFTEPVTVGRVYFAAVEAIDGGVEVWVGRKVGQPDYRIFNPPTLVSDPGGDIRVGDRTYREDPLAALAEVIMTTQPPQKGRRR